MQAFDLATCTVDLPSALSFSPSLIVSTSTQTPRPCKPLSLFALCAVVFYETDKSAIMSQASFWSWMFFVIGFGCLTVNTVQQYCFGVIASRLALKVRTQLFTNIMRQEVSHFC